jgi:hypothetical protein
MDKDMIKSMGYWLLGMLLQTALNPSAREASPIAVYKTFCHCGRMRCFSTAPAILPMRIVQVFTIVPSMLKTGYGK